MFSVIGVPVDPRIDLSMALDRARSWGEADKRKTQMIPISRALRPGFDLFVSLQVMPCLSACFVQEPPSLDVSEFRITDGVLQMLLGFIRAAIEHCLPGLRHFSCETGAYIGHYDLRTPCSHRQHPGR